MSRWDKLLDRILNLSNDLRYDELKRFLKHMGMKRMAQEAGAVIIHSERRDATR